MAYHASTGRTVLFGGWNGSRNLADHWEYDGQNWYARRPTATPTPRNSHEMTYDATRGRLVLHGGFDYLSSPPYFSDTWEWDGNTWLERTPVSAAPTRVGHLMAHDALHNTIVVFGGNGGSGPRTNETWEYFIVNQTSGIYATFGAGCPGTAGVPRLSAAPEQLPWVGETFTTELSSLPSNPLFVPLGVVGTSKTKWRAFNLPLSLDFIGMPGCTLHVSIDAAVALGNSGGRAVWPLPIPLEWTLAGHSFYQQALVLDRNANALGLTVSNAGQATIGAR